MIHFCMGSLGEESKNYLNSKS
nr:hypothetical chloroplast RF19 [Cardamine lyrata]UJH18277.1 hypothetical chloroplast RF19 [Cardamine lyrata]